VESFDNKPAERALEEMDVPSMLVCALGATALPPVFVTVAVIIELLTVPDTTDLFVVEPAAVCEVFKVVESWTVTVIEATSDPLKSLVDDGVVAGVVPPLLIEIVTSPAVEGAWKMIAIAVAVPLFASRIVNAVPVAVWPKVTILAAADAPYTNPPPVALIAVVVDTIA
jgi:hypothetical protein